VVCQASAIPGREAVEGYVYTRLAASASAAMRLMPIGQLEAHRTLAARLARVPAAVDAIVAVRGRPGAFAPQMDIAVMSHPHVHSRLFRS
jgi:urease accessory protein UreF